MHLCDGMVTTINQIIFNNLQEKNHAWKTYL